MVYILYLLIAKFISTVSKYLLTKEILHLNMHLLIVIISHLIIVTLITCRIKHIGVYLCKPTPIWKGDTFGFRYLVQDYTFGIIFIGPINNKDVNTLLVRVDKDKIITHL